MKKLTILVILLITTCTIAMAQPRAIGVRLGAAVGASYQHGLGEKNMLQIDLEFPVFTHMTVSAIYDWIIPMNVPGKGQLNLFAGVGGTVGLGWNLAYQYGTMKDGAGNKWKIRGYGYGYSWGAGYGYGRSGVGRPLFGVFGATGHFGVEYMFWFPLQVFCDWKPTFGGFIGSWKWKDADSKWKYSGFYVPGLYNIAVGARYCF